MWFSDGARTLALKALAVGLMALAGMPAQAISFHFAPANITVQARPGEVVNRTMTLTLAENAPPTHFKTRVEDWWRSADNERTFYAAPGTIARSCAPWCSINPAESSADPGKTLTVKLSIRVPDDVRPGGYWAALTIDEVPDPTKPKPEGVAMVFRASLSVGITVEVPTATRAARIAAVQVKSDRVSVTLANEGDIPLRINGTFEFRKDGVDQPIATVPVGGELLLPEPVNTCSFAAPLPPPDKLPSGKYKVRVIMDAGLDHLMGAEKELEITRSDERT